MNAKILSKIFGRSKNRILKSRSDRKKRNRGTINRKSKLKMRIEWKIDEKFRGKEDSLLPDGNLRFDPGGRSWNESVLWFARLKRGQMRLNMVEKGWAIYGTKNILNDHEYETKNERCNKKFLLHQKCSFVKLGLRFKIINQ